MNTPIEQRLLAQLTNPDQTIAELATSLQLSPAQVQTHLVSLFRRRIQIDTQAVAEDLAIQWNREEAA